jgi:hypothetical protein
MSESYAESASRLGPDESSGDSTANTSVNFPAPAADSRVEVSEDESDVNTSDDEAGSLVDFVVNDSESEKTPDERDEPANERDLLLKSLPAAWTNEVETLSSSNGRPKRIKKRPIRFEEQYADDIAKVMLEDVPPDELDAVIEDSDDEIANESTVEPEDEYEAGDESGDSDEDDEDDEDDKDDGDDLDEDDEHDLDEYDEYDEDDEDDNDSAHGVGQKVHPSSYPSKRRKQD